ncbi:hypothetical protein F4802DRAFT_618489 [Xylaria palmicola]|nr:hypothetical protein F4802DRAFT_618489 [Xylaria palmicola]
MLILEQLVQNDKERMDQTFEACGYLGVDAGHDEDSKRLEGIGKETDDILVRVIETANTIAEVLDKTKEEELRELYGWLLVIELPAGQDKTHENLANKIQDGEEYDKDTEVDEHYKFGRWFLNGETYRAIDLLIVSLLRQLANKSKGFPNDKTLEWFRSCQNSGRRPKKIEKLFQYLGNFISNIDKDVFIVLDGLDQIPARKGGVRGWPKLLELITNLTKAGYPNLHILLISRDEQDIRSCLTKLGDILVSKDIEEGLEGDLNNFIVKKLDDMQLLKGNTSVKDEVKKRLNRNGQDRNFLWATAVLADVAKCRYVKHIQEVLTKVPMSIVAVYETVLKNVKKEDEERMKSILLWLLNQLRPLSQNELVAAVGLPNSSLVTEICTRVFVELSKKRTTVAGKYRELDVFRVAHFSVQEYLESVISSSLENLAEKPEVARFNSPGQDAHFEMTKRCLAVLSACFLHQGHTDTEATDSDSGTSDANSDASTADADSEVEEDDAGPRGGGGGGRGSGCPEGPLLKYAAEYWFRHYKKINRGCVLEDKLKNLDDEIWSQLLFDKQKLEFWLKAYDPDHRSPIGEIDKTPSPVYYAVKLELVGIPERLAAHIPLPPVQNDDSPDDIVDRLDQPGTEGTALQLAAYQREFAVLDALIQRRADVNARPGPHGTALYASAMIGDEKAVRRLLDAKAKANSTEDGELGSPLHAAAYAGHDAVVVALIKEGGVPVDHEAGPFGTALQAASALRRNTTMKLLLRMGADPNIAASTYLELGRPKHWDKALLMLRNAGAKFFWGFDFWGTAYDKATSQDLRSERRIEAQHRVSRTYTILQLFASIKTQWRLPAKVELNGIQGLDNLLCRIPFEDQLDAILRLVPNQEVSIQDLNNSDFVYQALFWAGVNQILIMLKHLVLKCMDQVRMELRRGQGCDSRYGSRPEVAVLPSYAFRWAFDEIGAGYYRLLRAGDRRRNLFLLRHYEDLDSTSHVDRSDLVAMTLMQQRQALKRVEELDYREMLLSNRRDSPTQIPPAAKSIVWVTSDVLDLVKHLLEYGNNYLTFELFSAVIRLALALKRETIEVDKLAKTVQLLTTVRLERIRQLDAICKTKVSPAELQRVAVRLANTDNNNHDLKVQEIATEVTRQVEGIIKD